MAPVHTLNSPEKWLDLYGDRLYRFAFYKVSDRAQAEDLVQETLIAALHAQKRYSGRSTESTWLVGILKHKISDYYRKNGREIPQSDLNFDELPSNQQDFDALGRWKVGPQDWGDPDKSLERKELMAAIGQCLDHLPEKFQQAFSLREIDDLEAEDICSSLGITPNNLWVILHRARGMMRQCLEKKWA